jgi:hypothetical protein
MDALVQQKAVQQQEAAQKLKTYLALSAVNPTMAPPSQVKEAAGMMMGQQNPLQRALGQATPMEFGSPIEAQRQLAEFIAGVDNTGGGTGGTTAQDLLRNKYFKRTPGAETMQQKKTRLNQKQQALTQIKSRIMLDPLFPQGKGKAATNKQEMINYLSATATRYPGFNPSDPEIVAALDAAFVEENVKGPSLFGKIGSGLAAAGKKMAEHPIRSGINPILGLTAPESGQQRNERNEAIMRRIQEQLESMPKEDLRSQFEEAFPNLDPEDYGL